MDFKFNQLNRADFYPNAKYHAGNGKSYFANEPLSKLFKIDKYKAIGTQGGIRSAMVEEGNRKGEVAYLVLVNRKNQIEWPNKYYSERKQLIYFGDNKVGGRDYRDTKQKGNKRFEDLFINIRKKEQDNLFPIFYFEIDDTNDSDYRFIGLAYLHGLELVYDDERDIENLKASFIIDDTEIIPRKWLIDLKEGNNLSNNHAPNSWTEYIDQVKMGKEKVISEN